MNHTRILTRLGSFPTTYDYSERQHTCLPIDSLDHARNYGEAASGRVSPDGHLRRKPDSH